jgi:YgiT-type zinc finger domain-containing protein
VRFPTTAQRKEYPSECSLCRGSIEEQRVNLALPDRDGQIRIIDGVPAGVCGSIG